jgi:hypothetical protein
MISILDRQSRPTPPPWMEGAQDLASVVCHHGIIWSCAEPALIAGDGPWSDLGAGYAISGRFESADLAALRRAHGPYRAQPGVDLRGWQWDVACVLDADGARCFAASYGDDWMPILTDEQSRAVAICEEARVAFLAHADDQAAAPPMQAACAWAATLLGLTYHLSPTVIARARLLDDALVAAVLQIAADLPALRVDA